MAKYNLTEKKQKTPLYRSLLKIETVDELYQQIMAKFIVEKKYRDCNYSAKKMSDISAPLSICVIKTIILRWLTNSVLRKPCICSRTAGT